MCTLRKGKNVETFNVNKQKEVTHAQIRPSRKRAAQNCDFTIAFWNTLAQVVWHFHVNKAYLHEEWRFVFVTRDNLAAFKGTFFLFF